ncbi:MAG: tetratricopeptide repeat protein, partial [Thermoguttaceae bacterium]
AEIYKPEAATNVQAALGWAACLESQGKTAAAVEALKPLADKQAEVQAQLARLAFQRGDSVEARRRAKETLQLASEHPLALYFLGELARTSGRLDEAESHYRRLVSFYNGHDVKNAESLRWIGRAAAQYARWNRLGDQFDFLVNELFPSATKLDPDYWPAHFEAGLLFMEKYNRADATKEFQSALEINPRAAEVHVALAELAMEDFQLDQAEALLRRAMEINPGLPAAWRLKADVAWLNDQTAEALRLLHEKLLPLNPIEERTLARIAACYLVLDASPGKTASPRFDALAAAVAQRNRHAGDFYTELAEMLEIRNKHVAAERYYREAIRLLPRQPESRAGLGLLLMRMGREADARALLKEAFDADPFHVRVKNSLDVLDVIDAMQSQTTPHFVIKYDKADTRLIPYVARHLENVYGEIRQQFGYEPPGPTLVEIFNESQGQSGHAWFSARVVGLPFLGTVAASTGRIVAMTSPGETQTHGSFAWARTLKHEMTHVFNLQQTGYNIPHWFTEGLAVYNERIPRPYRWTVLLRRRADAGTLMDLETVNAGFARAMDGDECQLAYCQSELYVEYMLALGGSEAPKKMVAAYVENPVTEVALHKVFGISQAEFERGYMNFLRKQIEGTPVLAAPDRDHFDELEKAHRQQPKDANVAARLALALFQRDAKKEAAELAAEALKLESKQPLATYVLVRLQKAGTPQEAMARLECCLDRKAPEPLSLNLLAGMKLKAKEYDEAAELYALGERLDPANPQWVAALARVYLAADQKQNLTRALVRFAQIESDDLPSRKKLAELALERREAATARRWATEALEIQVEHADAHRLLAAALVELDEFDRAIEEFETAIELNPADLPQRFALADALLQAKQPAKAKKVLEELLRRDPKFPGADTLLESLNKKP